MAVYAGVTRECRRPDAKRWCRVKLGWGRDRGLPNPPHPKSHSVCQAAMLQPSRERERGGRECRAAVQGRGESGESSGLGLASSRLFEWCSAGGSRAPHANLAKSSFERKTSAWVPEKSRHHDLRDRRALNRQRVKAGRSPSALRLQRLPQSASKCAFFNAEGLVPLPAALSLRVVSGPEGSRRCLPGWAASLCR